jgi:hypothetical protein
MCRGWQELRLDDNYTETASEVIGYACVFGLLLGQFVQSIPNRYLYICIWLYVYMYYKYIYRYWYWYWYDILCIYIIWYTYIDIIYYCINIIHIYILCILSLCICYTCSIWLGDLQLNSSLQPGMQVSFPSAWPSPTSRLGHGTCANEKMA